MHNNIKNILDTVKTTMFLTRVSMKNDKENNEYYKHKERLLSLEDTVFKLNKNSIIDYYECKELMDEIDELLEELESNKYDVEDFDDDLDTSIDLFSVFENFYTCYGEDED